MYFTKYPYAAAKTMTKIVTQRGKKFKNNLGFLCCWAIQCVTNDKDRRILISLIEKAYAKNSVLIDLCSRDMFAYAWFDDWHKNIASTAETYELLGVFVDNSNCFELHLVRTVGGDSFGRLSFWFGYTERYKTLLDLE